MRAADAINLLQFLSPAADNEFINKLKTGKSGLLASEAENILEQASQEDKDNVNILAKKIILKFELGHLTDVDLNQLIAACLTVQRNANLAQTWQALYGNNQNNVKQPPQVGLPAESEMVIENNLTPGWFKQRALLRLYVLNRQPEYYRNLLATIKSQTWNFVFKLAVLGIAGIVFGFAGLIVIVWQLFFFKKSSRLSDAATAKYDWKLVFIVFYAWFCTQLLFGIVIIWLKKINVINLSVGSHSFAAALSIALIYMLSNGPALLYIYFFALKPQKLPFWQGINFRLGSDIGGTFKLFGIAILAWFAAIPLVLFAYLLSIKLFNCAGSSNPIIAIVMDAAKTDNFITILLFYLTLGILAPFVEESLFRGFFYTFLRGRYSAIFSNLLSSGLFALAHLDPGAVLPLFCLGSIFAYLVEITDSIVPAIIAHGLWNGCTFTLVLILFGNF